MSENGLAVSDNTKQDILSRPTVCINLKALRSSIAADIIKVEPYKQIFWAAEETPALLQSWSLWYENNR